MIPVVSFAQRKAAVFGLGGSGIATARALIAGGAKVAAWDDEPAAVEKARAAGIPVEDLAEADWSAYAALVLAPGAPLTHPRPHWTVAKARAAGVEIIGDIELFCRERRRSARNAPFVAITGTNGKSTTAALTAHVLRQAGRDA
ncbi:MAG TPA: UDP-N-acetylmuramoyl-L-alanine--D-glutamate ligase, partial [Roseiarcus sp.]|nr:UDP-N-acetylmuramoyl-L-alanine--D-glutamate ligase [Roseiarcus sp.]